MTGFDFSGLTLRVDGLPARHAQRLSAAWGAFETAPPAEPWLDAHVDVQPGRRRYRGEDAKNMASSARSGASSWAMIGGGAHVPPAGRVELRVEDAEADHTIFAVINLLHAAIAWRLPAIGGALLHAAGAVAGGRAFVLVGAQGSGKTTWAHLARAAGASVLSDDIVLVVPGAAGFDALGSPLRAKDFGGGVRGRWPLAALLLPRHGAHVALGPAPSLFVQAALTANLPFVADDPARRHELDAVVARLAAAVPARTLAFTREDGGIGALREAFP